MSLLFRRRHAEVLAGGGKFSGLHSLRELLHFYGFAGEWLIVGCEVLQVPGTVQV